MTTRSMTAQASGPIDSLLTQVASRVTLSAASRIAVGRLTVRLPDGSTRVFGESDSELRGEMHTEFAAVRTEMTTALRLHLFATLGAMFTLAGLTWAATSIS